MYLNKTLFLFWRRKIYLRSTGWKFTRKLIFKRQGQYCQRCGTRERLEVHHVDHVGQPKPRWWHFLPFARFFMFEIDRSKLLVLCHYHHAIETAKERKT